MPEFWRNLKIISKNTPIDGLKYRKVLISPLDWGLGHATRIIPLIRYLQQLKCQIWIAASGPTEILLKEEFPDISFLPLKGYRIGYQGQSGFFSWTILSQVPKIILAIFRERRWLKTNLEKYHWDLVISDNRYGLYNSRVKTGIIIHQIHIQTGMGKWVDQFVRWCNFCFLQKFDHCWIPDNAGVNNLAGTLSHGKLPANAAYIGPLSRFEQGNQLTERMLLILLSGPEPQRTLLENDIEKELKKYSGPVVIVRGLPGSKEEPEQSQQIQRFNHLRANELQRMLEKAGLIICRSGYTTIMDLVCMQKKAILIPTPGQAEQEYLAEYLMKENVFLSVRQDKFSLQSVLQKAETFPFLVPAFSYDQYQSIFNQWVSE